MTTHDDILNNSLETISALDALITELTAKPKLSADEADRLRRALDQLDELIEAIEAEFDKIEAAQRTLH